MPGWFATIVLVAARVAALIIVVPGLQNRFVPWRMRLTLLIFITMPVLCVIAPYSNDPIDTSRFITLLLQEASIGISLALVPAGLFWGLQLATESLQGMTGLPGGATEPDSQVTACRVCFSS